ncbi:MAG: exodeoxyribonuclease III [Polyangiaceae bacterium]|nr:exodeoxyribonuclease III [Polyangiaceae bacterium]
MKIATWNVNSLRAREGLVLDWLKRVEPDVLLMQETKVVDDDFPSDGFQRLGYSVVMAGQKTYNGVAIASRGYMRDIKIGLDGDPPDADKRLISAVVKGIRVFSAYIPNGKAIDNPSFPEKLDWLKRLRSTIEKYGDERPIALGGDFNVAMDSRDVVNVEAMEGLTHFHPDEHARMKELLELGLTDAFRLKEEAGGLFSWWDYRGGGFERNQGMRIDYMFLTRSLTDACDKAWMDVEERRHDKPSDHIPVVVELKL